ncbi:MAG: hypothetical protein ABR567_01360 [Myxococcales bacterium]|nr:hypothetical protein [Myxococcales bacterium]
MRALLVAVAISLPAAAREEPPAPAETPILVPSPIPVGFLLAWKPMVLSVRTDTGSGAQYGSDTFQPFRLLGRYTTTLLEERMLARAEIEGGEFRTDSQSVNGVVRIGSDGFDVTARALIGTAVRIASGFTITASTGLITRLQRGRAVGGAPNIGVFGATSNTELEFRVAPLVSLSAFIEGGLLPWAYAEQKDLGELGVTSEFRTRLQVSIDVSTRMSVDVGWDFTWWHASFTQSRILSPTNTPDQALLVEAREHALTIGLRWRPDPARP